MKKFMELTVQFKFVWGLFFTAAILIYVTISMIAGSTTMDLITVWQLVGVTLILTLYHYLFFGELILANMGLKIKLLIHSILCYITLAGFSHLFHWINISKYTEAAIFTVSYIFLYLACIHSFYIYYKATGEELNNRLTTYKLKRSINKEHRDY